MNCGFSLGQIIKSQVRMLHHRGASPSGRLARSCEGPILRAHCEIQVTAHVKKIFFEIKKPDYIEN